MRQSNDNCESNENRRLITTAISNDNIDAHPVDSFYYYNDEKPSTKASVNFTQDHNHDILYSFVKNFEFN